MNRRLLPCLALLTVLACDSPEPQPRTAATVDADTRQRELTFWRLYRAATAHRVSGDVAAAISRYDSALALKPDHGDALYHAGNAAFELGDYADAESRWRQLLAVDGSNARAHAQLGALYSCARPGAPLDLDRARHELQQALAMNRAETGPQLRLGEIALLTGDVESASRHLDAVRRTNARSVAAHFLGGYLLWRADQPAEAQSALEQAVAAATGQHGDRSASAEGQTKRGQRPLLEAGADSPLAPHWRRVYQLRGSVTSETTAQQYRIFHQALAQQRAALARSPAQEEDG